MSSIIVGYFSDLVFGVRLETNVQVLNEQYANSWRIGYLASMRVGSAVRRPQSFEVMRRVST